MATIITAVARSIPNRKDFLADAYDKYADSLKGYLMRTVSEVDAEDLMHDVYVRMAGHRGLITIDNLQAFMFTVATNLLRDRWRRANALHTPVLVNIDDFELAAGADDPAEVARWQESLESVSEAFEKIPRESRHAFTLSRSGGCSYAEIAEQLEVSVSMIEKHISSVLCRLRQAVV